MRYRIISLLLIISLMAIPFSLANNLESTTKSYEYEDDGIPPEHIKTSYRETAGTSNTYDEYTFTDGFGKAIQTKTEADNNKQIVINTYYDNQGRVEIRSNPYFTAFFENYTTPLTNISAANYTYDVLDRTIKVTNPDNTFNTANYTHWNITFIDENGNQLKHIYNAYQKIIQIREYNGNDIYITNYDYDAADNLIYIQDNLFNNWTYNYDSIGRKTGGIDPDTGVSNYTYDAVGNLISQSTGGGNLVTGDGYYREYDNFGRLKLIRNGNQANSSILEEYIYDGNGDRIKTFNHATNTTTYTPFREFTMIINSSGIYNYTYIYDSTDTLVARINPDNSKWYYHADHLGSTTLITNQSGDIVENTFYLPYGAIDEGGSAEDKLYEGKELDDTGQYYYGSRYYNPETALFTQPDSIIPDVYDPQQLNPYMFERGNPYSYVDPTGNFGVLAIGAFILGYALVDYAIDKFFGGSELSYAESFGQTIGETITDPQKTGEAAITFSGGVAIGKLLSKAGASAVSKGDEVAGGFSYPERSLQHGFSKHSKDFGITNNYNKQTATEFKNALNEFTISKDVQAIKGTYRGTTQGTHYYNPKTKQWAFYDNNGVYRASWKLDPKQEISLKGVGNVQ